MTIPHKIATAIVKYILPASPCTTATAGAASPSSAASAKRTSKRTSARGATARRTDGNNPWQRDLTDRLVVTRYTAAFDLGAAAADCGGGHKDSLRILFIGAGVALGAF